MLIGELADAAGLYGQTIRFYERKRLLPSPKRGANGYRNYDESSALALQRAAHPLHPRPRGRTRRRRSPTPQPRGNLRTPSSTATSTDAASRGSVPDVHRCELHRDHLSGNDRSEPFHAHRLIRQQGNDRDPV
ncbi:MerR family DNA-binding transcriptional regulator [Ornithinimicrobium ciconiae]|uniref:MerR family DNA-binding transcriptional regulator n=1 Tax=Ornithinimicrobium ciconiae TaxID=2594265 RepID=A0A516GFG9_9MICO|nr:MerR family DNA-binding transcriptional regulator [Ornithinimicrobium ciconiae]